MRPYMMLALVFLMACTQQVDDRLECPQAPGFLDTLWVVNSQAKLTCADDTNVNILVTDIFVSLDDDTPSAVVTCWCD